MIGCACGAPEMCPATEEVGHCRRMAALYLARAIACLGPAPQAFARYRMLSLSYTSAAIEPGR